MSAWVGSWPKDLADALADEGFRHQTGTDRWLKEVTAGYVQIIMHWGEGVAWVHRRRRASRRMHFGGMQELLRRLSGNDVPVEEKGNGEEA